MTDTQPEPAKQHAKVADLMVSRVMSTTPSQTIGHVRAIMAKKKVSCMPVAGPNGKPVGIITASDLIDTSSNEVPVSSRMSGRVFTVPQYADVSLAARTMRNNHIHHLVVVHEKKIVGVISSFDLLRLVEDHRFSMKNSPTPPRKPKRLSGGQRDMTIHGHTGT